MAYKLEKELQRHVFQHGCKRIGRHAMSGAIKVPVAVCLFLVVASRDYCCIIVHIGLLIAPGFKRSIEDTDLTGSGRIDTWMHPFFRRGQKELLAQIERRTMNASSCAASRADTPISAGAGGCLLVFVPSPFLVPRLGDLAVALVCSHQQMLRRDA
jgi:hypothetical protein